MVGDVNLRECNSLPWRWYMDIGELKKELASIRWRHRMDLGNGIITPGVDDPAQRLRRMHLPEDLSGMTVLDVGACDGFFSFEAERRRASRVVALDKFYWGVPGWRTNAGFDLARKALDSKVEDREMDVMDISPDTVGTYDVVLFIGVLYHMRHPLLALERVASVTRHLLVLETAIDDDWSSRPSMVFYPDSELAGDPTNWWGPNTRAVKAMLKDVGFSNVRVVWKGSWARRFASAVNQRVKHHTPLLHGLQRIRAVFHARR